VTRGFQKIFCSLKPSREFRDWNCKARNVVEGFLSGFAPQPLFRAVGPSSCQHREYVRPETIPRRIDWKVWSKTDKYYIKAIRRRNESALARLLG